MTKLAGALGRVLTIGGWGIAGVLSVLLASRLLAWDRWQPLVVVDAFTHFVFFPAWVVTLVAVFCHRRALALLAVAVMIGHIALVLPELTADKSLPAIAGHPSLVLFDANVYQGNPSMNGYVAAIRSDNPDIVALEEATPTHRSELATAGVFRALPYQFDVPRGDSTGFLLASRFPLTNTRVIDFEGRPLVVQTDVTIARGMIRLWVVHTVAPVGSDWHEWTRQLSTLARMVNADTDHALMVVGDFNSTWGNRGFRRILSAGLTDAAAARGHPFQMTWSRKFPVLPPLVRIDHILTNHGIVISHIKNGPGTGSDHRSLLATAVLT